MPTRGEIAATFDAIAAEFDATRTRPWPETIAFESSLPIGSQVLDLGCGGGRNLTYLRGNGHTVVGLDASGGLLGIAAAKVGARALVRADAIALPFRSATFGGVHCVATVHHLPSEAERRQCLAEVARILRPNGLFLGSAWAHEQDRFRDGPVDVSVPWRRSDGRVVPRFYHLFRSGELDGLARAVGLAVVRSWREGDNHVVLARR